MSPASGLRALRRRRTGAVRRHGTSAPPHAFERPPNRTSFGVGRASRTTQVAFPAPRGIREVEVTTGNRGYFVSNKRESPMNAGHSFSNANYAGSRDPIGYPIDAIADRPETRKPLAIGFSKWRDPDSNRGHHDFQDSAQGSLTRRNPCIDTGSRAERRARGLLLFATFRNRSGTRTAAGTQSDPIVGQRSTAAMFASSWRSPAPA